MREKGFGPKPEDTEIVDSPPVQDGEFMANWLRRRKKSPETEDDEDKETGKKPKSRFSRLFSKLFPRIASKEEVSPERPPIPLYELFMPPTPPAAERPEEITAQQVDAIETQEYNPEPPATDNPEKNADQPIEQTPDPIQPDRLNVEEVAPPVEERLDPAMISLREREFSEPISERTVFERRTEVAEPKRERIIERRVAEPLAVLEYFLRRRAVKNIEKQVKKETASLEKRLRQGSAANERLEKLAQKSQEQVSELRQKREIIQSPVIKSETNERIVERQVSRPEKPPTMLVEKMEPTETIAHHNPESRKVDEDKEPIVQPERILERVVEAAEHNAPIEKVYERRHEIKDEPSAKGSGFGGGAIPIGTVINQAMQQNNLSAKERKQLARAVEKAHQNNNRNLYKQAAISGFWTALVIIVSLTIAILMRN
jgi:hypothetical protein